MVVAEREAHVGALEVLQRRHDVHDRQPLDPLGVVQRQPVRHPRAAVVRRDLEAFVAEAGHQLRHVLGHPGLGVGRVVRRGAGLVAAAVAAEVRADHREAARERGGDGVPHRVALRVAVQQEQRRPGAAEAEPKRAGGDAPGREREAVEEAGGHPISCSRANMKSRNTETRFELRNSSG